MHPDLIFAPSRAAAGFAADAVAADAAPGSRPPPHALAASSTRRTSRSGGSSGNNRSNGSRSGRSREQKRSRVQGMLSVLRRKSTEERLGRSPGSEGAGVSNRNSFSRQSLHLPRSIDRV